MIRGEHSCHFCVAFISIVKNIVNKWDSLNSNAAWSYKLQTKWQSQLVSWELFSYCHINYDRTLKFWLKAKREILSFSQTILEITSFCSWNQKISFFLFHKLSKKWEIVVSHLYLSNTSLANVEHLETFTYMKMASCRLTHIDLNWRLFN